MRQKLVQIFILFIFSIFSICGNAQSFNADSIFTKARNLAFEGKRSEARQLCKLILKNNPEYNEVGVFCGRVYAWDKIYDSAQIEILKVIKLNKNYKDGWLALYDVVKWSEKYDSAFSVCKKALEIIPNDSDLMFSLAEASFLKEDYIQAKEIATKVKQLYPQYSKIDDLLNKIDAASRIDRLSIDYLYEYYITPHKWQLQIISLDYGVKTSKGSYYAGINFADLRINNDHPAWNNPAFQIRFEMYPRFREKYHAFINYSLGPNGIFPLHRAGLELYRIFNKKYEASLGARFLQFKGGANHENVMIYTGSIGRYFEKYYITFRPYFTTKSTGLGQAYSFEARKFLKKDESWISLYLISGNSPDELTNNLGNKEIYLYNSKKVLFGYQDWLNKRLLILLKLGYTIDEYEQDKMRGKVEMFCKFYFLI